MFKVNQPPNPPIIGQQQAQMQAAVQGAIQQMAAGIYTRVAASSLTNRDEQMPVNTQRLQQAARDSLQAARCYFAGIGVIEEEEGNSNGKT